LAAWAAAAATAAAPDADAEHFLILDRTTSVADAISYHICCAGVIFLPLPPPPFHPPETMSFGILCKITDIFQYFL